MSTTNIFQCKDEMPPVKDVVSVAMVREETAPDQVKMSGERRWPGRAIVSVERPRKGHDY